MKSQRQVIVLVTFFLVAAIAADALAATPRIDFNNDGFGDLAIAAPYATVDGKEFAGTVTVLYGTSTGLSSASSQVLRYDQLIVGPQPTQEAKYDFFGHALAAADFNGDGFTDLAIGVPRTDSNPSQPGVVIVAYGHAYGIKLRASWCPCPLQPQSFTMPTPQPHDRFGSALAAGDFKFDGYADLAAAAPDYDIGSTNFGAGAVRMMHGGPNKLAAIASILSVNAQPHASFGYSLAAGNFGKTAAADLAIGIPFRDNVHLNGGSVAVIYGSVLGLRPTPVSDGGGGMFWVTQDDTAFTPERNSDYFGWALAAGDFGTGGNAANAGFDDLGIGIPGREVTTVIDAGAVTVLYGAVNGFSHTGSQQQWSLAPLQGSPVQGDSFGLALIAGNLGYDGQADLAIGVPYHPVNGLYAAGVVSLVFGTPTGLSGANNKLVHMAGNSQSNAFLGAALSAAQFDGNGYVDLAIGIPRWNVSTALGDAGAVSIRYGTATGPASTASNQFWTAAAPESQARFGFALSK
jgi:hypothetical protein